MIDTSRPTVRVNAVRILLLLFVALEMAGCVVSRNPLSGRSRAYGYSWQQEIQIGLENDQAIQQQFGLYDDADLATYIDSLGQSLLQVSHLRREGADPEFSETQFYFRVLDSPVVNAFALPGGYVYVTRGLLAHLENEAQLAVVLGHEIGHVAGRHASKRAASQLFGQVLLIGGAVGGQVLFGDDVGSAILNLGSTAASLLFLRYGRDDERESDNLGVEYAALTRYRAGEGSAFFGTLRRLGEQSGQSLPGFLSTHPDPGEREQTVLQLAAEWETRVPMDRVARDRFLRALDGIVAGENPRQGFTRDATFYHPDLALQFPVPDGFQVVNQASRVVLVGPEQKALVFFGIEADMSTAREAAEAFARKDGVTVVQSGIGSASGLPASYVVAETTDENGQVLRMRAHYVDYDSRVYSFIGLTAQKDYAQYEPSFVRAMQGFAPLRDPGILAVQPSRLMVRRTDRDAPFRSFVPTSIPAGFTPESMAILNQLALDDLLGSGTALKLIQ